MYTLQVVLWCLFPRFIAFRDLANYDCTELHKLNHYWLHIDYFLFLITAAHSVSFLTQYIFENMLDVLHNEI